MAEFSISSLGQLMDDRILDNGDGTFSIVAEKIVDENLAPYKYGSNVQSFTAISSITAGQVVSTRHSNMVSPTLVGGSSYASTAFGIAQTSLNMNEQQLIENADKALYRAKKQGRNQVVHG